MIYRPVQIVLFSKVIMGQSPPSSSYNEDGEGLPFFQGKAEFTNLYPIPKKWCSTPKKIAEENDILVSVRAPVGSTNIANQKCCIGRGLAAIRYPDCPRYLFYFFRSIEKKLDSLGTGTTFKAISTSTLKNLEIPLPPLTEQHRIVEKIEELFSELDNGIDNLKKAKAQIKTYRQAVLKFAFEGKLVQGKGQKVKGKSENGELPEGWEWVKVSKICEVVRGGSPRPAGDLRYYVGDIPFLKVKDLTKDSNKYLDSFEYTIKEAGLKKTRLVKSGTLLITNSGATLGVPKIIQIDATMNDGIAAFLNLDSRSNLYMYYFWLSKTAELRNINMGAAQPNLNTTIIKNYMVPLCSFDEQAKIVEEIERRFSVADKLEAAIDESLKKSEALRQSILKQAFEGKLV